MGLPAISSTLLSTRSSSLTLHPIGSTVNVYLVPSEPPTSTGALIGGVYAIPSTSERQVDTLISSLESKLTTGSLNTAKKSIFVLSITVGIPPTIVEGVTPLPGTGLLIVGEVISTRGGI